MPCFGRRSCNQVEHPKKRYGTSLQVAARSQGSSSLQASGCGVLRPAGHPAHKLAAAGGNWGEPRSLGSVLGSSRLAQPSLGFHPLKAATLPSGLKPWERSRVHSKSPGLNRGPLINNLNTTARSAQTRTHLSGLHLQGSDSTTQIQLGLGAHQLSSSFRP